MHKATKRQKKQKSYIIPLFWAAFAAVIILLFIINLPLIRQTVNATHLGERLTGLPPIRNDHTGENGEKGGPGGGTTGTIEGNEVNETNEANHPSLEEELARLTEGISPAAPQDVKEYTGTQAEQEARERTVYFMRMDSDGLLVRTQEKRRIANAAAPLLDTITLLLAGTTAEEEARGLTTLIPAGTVLISAAMRGDTAVLNFNENFMFNNYGAEGYLAQLRQIVWTATEFQNVKNVQFLIEGRRVDFLGDNIRIDRPIARDELGQL
jgi:spore germination protein GerM